MAFTLILDTSVTNVTGSYATTCKPVTNAPTSGFFGVINKTSTIIMVTNGSFKDTSVPASTAAAGVPAPGFPVLDTGGATTLDWFKVNQGDAVFVRSADGSTTINSGKIYFIFK